jgi:hypothetical protein
MKFYMIRSCNPRSSIELDILISCNIHWHRPVLGTRWEGGSRGKYACGEGFDVHWHRSSTCTVVLGLSQAEARAEVV